MVPTAYEWRVAVDPAAERFQAEVRIDVRVAAAAPVLWLNAIDLDISEAWITREGQRARARVVPGSEGIIGLETDAGFEPGDQALEIRYAARLEPTATRGLFRQREGGDWYAITQFEPTSGRRALPCFDEPAWKTPWRVTVDAPSRELVVSNTPEESSAPAEGRSGWTRHVFARTKPLPVYLVAFAVGPFDIAQDTKAGAAGTPLRFLAPKGHAADAHHAREATPGIVAALEAYFGRPFPFAKLDSVPIPSAVGFGAMEYAGMITYSAAIMLARGRQESLAFRRDYNAAAAHEIAHQWFGDLVTMAWWDDVWLNEAFATWMSEKVLATGRPEFASPWRVGEMRQSAIWADRLMSARRVANPVAELNDLYGAFDAITYRKGAEVISMFESWMGEERFREGVRDYLARHAYGNARTEDFFHAVGKASARPEIATRAMRSFIEQAGVPLVDVRLACEAGPARVELDPHRFVPRGQQGEDHTWTTPACFRYAAGGQLHKRCIELTGRQSLELESSGCPDWLVGNADGAGDWIARLDDAAFARVAPRIASLPEREAVAFGINARVLALTGSDSVEHALRIARELLRHKGPGAERTGIEILDGLRDGMLGAADREQLARIHAEEVRPLAARIGWTPGEKETLAVQDLRTALLAYAAADADDTAARRQAAALATRWLANHDAVDASVARPALVTAGRFADAALFGSLEEALRHERNRADRRLLLQALAAVRHPGLRERALSLAVRAVDSGGLEAPDAFELMEKALRDKHNREAAFAFVRKNWDALVARLPPDSAHELMVPLQDLCSAGERERFREFFAPRASAMRGGPRAYAQSLESIDICVAALAPA